jgi:hypothetical protein
MSQASMNQLASFCTDLIDRIPVAANKRKSDAVLSIENALTQTTPIDEGYAISNWQVTRNTPAREVIEPYAPSEMGVHDHHVHGPVGGGPLNAAGAMNAARTALQDVKPGETVYISNPLPYIEVLNVDGTSDQASPGFVERSITLGVDVAGRAKLDP